MNECGICNSSQPDLICCEVCPSVYHLNCLSIKILPKGKWMCVYCRIVKDGIKSAINTDPINGQRISKMFYVPLTDWKSHCMQIVNILLLHPCSRDMAPANPRKPIKGIPPQDLSQVRMMVHDNMYGNLEEFDQDIRNIWKNYQKVFRKKNPVVYLQAFYMQLFHNKIVSELQELIGLQINTQPINIPTKRFN